MSGLREPLKTKQVLRISSAAGGSRARSSSRRRKNNTLNPRCIDGKIQNGTQCAQQPLRTFTAIAIVVSGVSQYGFTFCRLRSCAIISLALPLHNTERAAWYTSLMLEATADRLKHGRPSTINRRSLAGHATSARSRRYSLALGGIKHEGSVFEARHPHP